MKDLTCYSKTHIIEAGIRQYVEQALSDNTRKAYKNDLAHYCTWGGTIPASPEQVAAYLTAYAGVLSIATLQRRLISITKAYDAGLCRSSAERFGKANHARYPAGSRKAASTSIAYIERRPDRDALPCAGHSERET